MPDAIRTDAVGNEYPAVSFFVRRDDVVSFSRAVGETNPIHLDVESARAAGHADLVAPPMFAVVYARDSVLQATSDPEVAMQTDTLVHGGQEFRWYGLVVAGDTIATSVRVQDIFLRRNLGFYVFESVSRNQAEQEVCVAKWTNIVRFR